MRSYIIDVLEIIEAIKKPTPQSCAVYVFSDAAESVLYVGKTLNPIERFGRHIKDKEWFEEIRYFELEWCVNETDALNREAELILELRPHYNKQKNGNRDLSINTKRYWRQTNTMAIIRQVKHEMGLSNNESYMNLLPVDIIKFTTRRDELLNLRHSVLSKPGHL